VKQNLTSGSPAKGIFLFTLPMLLGNMLQQLYTMTDSAIVGRFVGQDALASVGASGAVVFFIVNVAVGFSFGCSVVISHNFGAGKLKEMREGISTSFIFMMSIAVLLSILGYIFTDEILKGLNTTSELMPDAVRYLKIYFAGFASIFFYNSLASYFRAIGDSKTPLYFLIVAGVLNIVLDLIFVVVFSWGVAGAAWATVLSQLVSGLLCLIYIKLKIPILHFKKEEIVFNKKVLGIMAGYGVPSAFQISIISVGMLSIQGLVNGYGSDVLAGYTAAIKVDSFATLPIVNFGAALSTYTAQNMGAGKIERVRKGYKATILMGFAFSVIISCIIFLSGQNMIGLFMDSAKSEAAIGVGIEYIYTLSIFYVVFSSMIITNGILRGSGDMTAFLYNSILMVTVRVVSAYMLDKQIGYRAIWWSFPIGWFIGMVLAVFRYRSGKWMQKGVNNKKYDRIDEIET
jgi:putative MATE family efflux protein